MDDNRYSYLYRSWYECAVIPHHFGLTAFSLFPVIDEPGSQVCVCGKEKVRERVLLHVFAVDHNSWLNIKQLLIVLSESHTAAISRHCSLSNCCVCLCVSERVGVHVLSIFSVFILLPVVT